MRNNWHQDSASLPGTDPFFKTCFKVVKISLFIFVLPKKRGRKCVWLHVCVCFVCFIVMSRTSSIVPCQVVPSQLAVANAFVLCCAVYSPYDIVVKSLLICSAFLIHFVCVCVCMAVTQVWGKNQNSCIRSAVKSERSEVAEDVARL